MYFGGLGAGKGWKKFYFCISPRQLEEVLRAVNPVLLNDLTFDHDISTLGLAAVVESYRQYLENCLGERNSSSVEPFFQVWLSKDLKIFQPAEIIRHKKPVRVLSAQEPAVNFQSSTLSEYRGKIHVDVMAKDGIPFGLRQSFPRVISLDSEGFSILRETATHRNHILYEEIKSHVEELTVPCKIKTGDRTHRTRFRIAPELIARVNGCPDFLEMNFTIV